MYNLRNNLFHYYFFGNDAIHRYLNGFYLYYLNRNGDGPSNLNSLNLLTGRKCKPNSTYENSKCPPTSHVQPPCEILCTIILTDNPVYVNNSRPCLLPRASPTPAQSLPKKAHRTTQPSVTQSTRQCCFPYA